MECDTRAPAIRGRPYQRHAEKHERDQSEDVMCASVPEVDQHHDRGDRKPIADDGERPRVSRIALVDEAARPTGIEVMRPSREELASAAMRAAFGKAAAQRGPDHCTAVSVMSKSSVAFGGMPVRPVLPYALSGGMISRR